MPLSADDKSRLEESLGPLLKDSELVEFAVILIQNGKSVGDILKEMKDLSDSFDQGQLEAVLKEFLDRRVVKITSSKGENALTMAGALGANRNKKEKKDKPKKENKQREEPKGRREGRGGRGDRGRSDRGGGGRGRMDGRGDRRGRTSRAFDRLTDAGRGRGDRRRPRDEEEEHHHHQGGGRRARGGGRGPKLPRHQHQDYYQEDYNYYNEDYHYHQPRGGYRGGRGRSFYRGGRGPPPQDDTTANHPSPIVRYGGRTGRGRFSAGRAHVQNLLASKTWVRNKDDSKTEEAPVAAPEE